MEYISRLKDSQIAGYAHMIPQWLIESPKEGADVQFFGMEDFDIPCGVAVTSGEAGVVTLQYIYIAREYRKAGRGSRLLAELLMRAYYSGNHEFRVKYIPGEYPEFEKLLSGYPFTGEEEMIGNFRCTLEELSRIKQFVGKNGNVRALADCTEEELRGLYKEVVEKEDDFIDIPIKKRDYLTSCSAVALEAGKPSGLLLVQEKSEKEVNVPFLVNYSKNILAPIEMFRFAVQTGSRKYPPETVCSFAVVNETLFRLLEKLGIESAGKRRRCSLPLSYFAQYEKKVENYVNGLTNRI